MATSGTLKEEKATDGLRVSTKSEDVENMHRALQLAWQSNPVKSAYCVGCVIVDNKGQVLSDGYSREIEGNTHAEECALLKLAKLQTNLRGLKMYTTMEPCTKRTSGNKPCTCSILEANCIQTVYLGVAEPKEFVNCEGISDLIQNGVEVLAVQIPSNPAKMKSLCLRPNQHILDHRGRQPVRIRMTAIQKFKQFIKSRFECQEVLPSEFKIKSVKNSPAPILGRVTACDYTGDLKGVIGEVEVFERKESEKPSRSKIRIELLREAVLWCLRRGAKEIHVKTIITLEELGLDKSVLNEVQQKWKLVVSKSSCKKD
ncbi:hypothetical protein AAMO2058_001523500 [Amorphochlora amoebiformis]